MNGSSQSPIDEKINALRALMPEVFDEGKIDWEKLKATLGESVDFSNERYVLNWAGKSDAFRVMQRPSSATLVPCREESVDFDTTQNIFIEGENMEVLKVLQKSYFGKIKMIYIDPPYNTGNDSFIYPDKFSETKEAYLRRVGDKDEDGYMTRDGMFRKNSKENGQYHSNWLSMMMPRLYLAKSLLREDGVIFISIDDNEVHNLRLLMNEIFGEENFVAELIWKSKSGGANDSRYIAIDHEYILCYAKDADNLPQFIDKNAVVTTSYNLKDERGEYALDRLDKQSLGYIESLDYPIVGPDGTIYTVEHKNQDVKVARWRWSEETVKDRYDELVFKNGYVYTKNYKKDSSISRSLLIDERFGRTRTGKTDFTDIFEAAYFSSPKPIKLIRYFIDIIDDKEATILDFFAGSGTTAHAVMQLNKEDGGNRKFICVQLSELCDANSEAYKAGYRTIADISKERIRRASAKIRAEVATEQAKQQGQLSFDDASQTAMPDLGFKVFKLSDSNFKEWREIHGTDQEQWKQQTIDFLNPVAENATTDNLVYELLLKNGKNLNSTIRHEQGCYNINSGELILLLESANQATLDYALSQHPQKVIALDSLFEGNDQLKTNTALQFRAAGINFKTI
ncbi:MAG: site-specific DNA-methyltransferase [Bacteroidales bacterium]|nr:site-specific DNA-methyltransferase [Bacteroidales bacterium]